MLLFVLSETCTGDPDNLERFGIDKIESFFLFPTTTIEIENEIIGLNANKSVGPYSTPAATKHVLSAPLEIISKAAFSTGIVSDLFKIAKVNHCF